jgi:hypothetical protein
MIISIISDYIHSLVSKLRKRQNSQNAGFRLPLVLPHNDRLWYRSYQTTVGLQTEVQISIHMPASVGFKFKYIYGLHSLSFRTVMFEPRFFNPN